MWIRQQRRKKEYKERKKRGRLGKRGLKMKHNERISPEAWIVYPEHFLFSTIKDGKTCQCCAFYLSILALYTSILFLCTRPLKWLTFKGDLIVVFLFHNFSSHKASFAVSCLRYPVSAVVKLHWSGTKINILISFNKPKPKGVHIISFKTFTV